MYSDDNRPYYFHHSFTFVECSIVSVGFSKDAKSISIEIYQEAPLNIMCPIKLKIIIEVINNW